MKALLETIDEILCRIEFSEERPLSALPEALERLAAEAVALAGELRMRGEGASGGDPGTAARRDALLQRGLFALAGADLKGAERIFEEALELFPEHADLRAHLGLVAWERGDVRGAARHYEEAARIGLAAIGGADDWRSASAFDYLRALEGRALCLYQLGEHDEARAIFETIGATGAPSFQGCFYLAGEIAQLSGDHAGALKLYERAPREPSTLYNAGLACWMGGEVQRAASYFVRGLASNRHIASVLLGRPIPGTWPCDELSGYSGQRAYAEEFARACRPIWSRAGRARELLDACARRPEIEHYLADPSPDAIEALERAASDVAARCRH